MSTGILDAERRRSDPEQRRQTNHETNHQAQNKAPPPHLHPVTNLVQQQQVRARPRRLGERDARLLPAREAPHRARGEVDGDAKAREVAAQRGLGDAREGGGEVGQRGRGQVEAVDVVLRVEGDARLRCVGGVVGGG